MGPLISTTKFEKKKGVFGDGCIGNALIAYFKLEELYWADTKISA